MGKKCTIFQVVRINFDKASRRSAHFLFAIDWIWIIVKCLHLLPFYFFFILLLSYFLTPMVVFFVFILDHTTLNWTVFLTIIIFCSVFFLSSCVEIENNINYSTIWLHVKILIFRYDDLSNNQRPIRIGYIKIGCGFDTIWDDLRMWEWTIKMFLRLKCVQICYGACQNNPNIG